jgi:hypothetical protein
MTSCKLLSRGVANPSNNGFRLLATIFAGMLVIGCGGSDTADSINVAPPTIVPAPAPIPTPAPKPDPTFKIPPQGVFNSAGSLKSDSQPAIVNETVNGQSYMSGSLVRIGWDFVNPVEGEFYFGLIARELEQAKIYNSAISLAIMDGKAIPQWVKDKCETFDYTIRNEPATTCLPWDPEYLRYKQVLVEELGKHFDSHPNLAGVYFTYAAMGNGVEMHWRVDEADYTAVGYSANRLLQAYNDVMDMYANAFKTTSVIMEIHAVFNESYLAEGAFNHCYERLGERCGVAIWWCASRMATDPKESEYKVFHVAQQAVELSFAVCQTVGNFTDQPDRFDQGQGWTTEEAFRNEMDFFIGQGFRNFELWSKDIKNQSLIDIMEQELSLDFD